MNPNAIPRTLNWDGDDPDRQKPNTSRRKNINLIRGNPESYVWFCVGYWYYLNYKDKSDGNIRWGFQNGLATPINVESS